jgi:hypothetical protein
MRAIAPTRNRGRNNVSTKHQKWSPEEDALLLQIAKDGGPINWKQCEARFPGKTSQQIFERYTKVLDPGLHKGSWTPQEDEVIINFVKTYGCKSWTKLAKMLPGRIGKQCRERWLNHLNPTITRDPWTPEEDELLMKLHKEHGNSWSKIAARMPNRADNMIKNRWYSTLSKRVNVDGEMRNVIDQEYGKTAAVVTEESGNDLMTAMPKPVMEETSTHLDAGGPWTPCCGTAGSVVTPILHTRDGGGGRVPPYVFFSPIIPSQIAFSLPSPVDKMIGSPWINNGNRMQEAESPGKRCSPPTLVENREQLLNLIVHQ